jgi:hypothetical protein
MLDKFLTDENVKVNDEIALKKKISFFAVIVLGTNKKQCKPITERYFPNAIFTW